MFFVFNKPKIYSYLIVLSTVVVLFFTAEVLSEANNLETMTTSAHIENQENNTIRRLNTDKKEIVILINCLETNKNIKDILNILEKNNVNACFGISGEWVKKYPELTIEISNKGHSIIVIPDNYMNINDFDYNETLRNISDGINKIGSLIEKKLKLIGCPYNKNNENIIKVAKENNYRIIEGSIDTLDYQGLEANTIWDNIKNRITNGDIILMNSNSTKIIDEVEMLIDSLKGRGYEFAKIEDRISNYE